MYKIDFLASPWPRPFNMYSLLFVFYLFRRNKSPHPSPRGKVYATALPIIIEYNETKISSRFFFQFSKV